MTNKAIICLAICCAAARGVSAGCAEAGELFRAGKIPEALGQLPAGAQACPGLAAQIYLDSGKFQEAEAAALAAVKADPADYDSALALARLLSWRGDFKASAGYYAKAAALKPADYLPELEKARVLAWDKRYTASDAAYDAAFARAALDWIKEENLGKAAMRGARPRQALGHLRKAVLLNPDDSEALFDIAQFYSNCGLYRQAEPWYARLAAASPYNSAAASSRAKNAAYGRGYALRAGMSLWNADGADRMTDVKYLNSYVSAEKLLSSELALRLTGGHGRYSFSGTPSIDENSGEAALDYRPGRDEGAGASYGSASENRTPRGREQFSLYYWRKPAENLTAAVSYGRENLINNAGVFAADLHRDSFRGRLDWDVNGSLSAGADYRAGTLSDSNRLKIGGADATLFFSREPSALYAQLRYERQAYRRTSSLYFAPGAYDLYALTAGYKLNFGPDGLYYGARDDYFEVKCRAAYDTTPYMSLNPSAALNLGFGGLFGLRAEYSLTSSHYYRDNYYGLSAVKAF